MKEFIPEDYRWNTYDELKEKIQRYIEQDNVWEMKRKQLWSSISVLKPQTFEEKIWSAIQTLQ
jgi:hypothetical protein